MLSEGLDTVRATIKCNVCGYQEQQNIKEQTLTNLEQSFIGKACPNCKNPTLAIAETQDIIDNFAELAEATNAGAEVISTETEEGQMLKKSFGGVGAILRFKLHE